ncbi:hypothetical protein MPL3356_110420 [Mesorhizobium plurifarium]|uniref:RNA polymerase sigma factor 70 region 4 type 2 domain-containing protein n=1 Tax=Mesorhizobium plurifarium TaxID=69974 RepID=A0A090DFJ2_MESPL|nr:hypothetical protein MPL3356_110420 [Mesorhizobium plurifarium]
MTQTGQSDASQDLVALTHKKKDGSLYFRRPEVEQEIRAAAQRPLQELLSKTPPVSNECLLYFIRNYRPNGSSPVHDTMVTELLRRVDQRVIARTGGVRANHRTQIRADIDFWFKDKIYAGSDSLDVYEFAFNLALKTRIIDTIRRYDSRDGVEIGEDAFGDGSDEKIRPSIDVVAFRANAGSRPPAEVRAELHDVMRLLTDRERKALIATEYYGLDQKEAGRLLGVTARRIRQYLESARAKVAHLKETKQ